MIFIHFMIQYNHDFCYARKSTKQQKDVEMTMRGGGSIRRRDKQNDGVSRATLY